MELAVIIASTSIFFNGLISLMWWSVKQKILKTNNHFDTLFSKIEDLTNAMTGTSKDIASISSKQAEHEARLNKYSEQSMKHLEAITEMKTRVQILERNESRN